jgi:hypothetical protein
MTDWFVLLFTGSIFFSALVINDALANSTKLVLLALFVVLYFNIRIIISSLHNKEAATFNSNLFTLIYLILTGLVEALWGLQQLYGFKPSQHTLFKLTGSFFNPGPYAGYSAVVFFPLLSVWVNDTQITRMGADENGCHRALDAGYLVQNGCHPVFDAGSPEKWLRIFRRWRIKSAMTDELVRGLRVEPATTDRFYQTHIICVPFDAKNC